MPYIGSSADCRRLWMYFGALDCPCNGIVAEGAYDGYIYAERSCNQHAVDRGCSQDRFTPSIDYPLSHIFEQVWGTVTRSIALFARDRDNHHASHYLRHHRSSHGLHESLLLSLSGVRSSGNLLDLTHCRCKAANPSGSPWESNRFTV